MKRAELIRHLLESGCVFEKEGKKHTIFYNPESWKSAAIPRHKEINTFTARGICKDLEIEVIRKR
ncbi:MAG: addiction module toxin, HicA family [Elusimicrobia bacterium CG1_02_37_114]|nr:MAG: addiction module toxin, HicA family [Elusimicrobia bacterium CG1_02_37_114]PIV52907.1 MAG: addiction module toxin, HicA family [Elusimicrobia bacterium CG02_land_8_20_14_3_00_37_13]PIZ13255.1 MAG: addiction module toxin, HicA family [Elusimicrobia bacterium CG_4_10_14_0_8_um_filter_37_32]